MYVILEGWLNVENVPSYISSRTFLIIVNSSNWQVLKLSSWKFCHFLTGQLRNDIAPGDSFLLRKNFLIKKKCQISKEIIVIPPISSQIFILIYCDILFVFTNLCLFSFEQIWHILSHFYVVLCFSISGQSSCNWSITRCLWLPSMNSTSASGWKVSLVLASSVGGGKYIFIHLRFLKVWIETSKNICQMLGVQLSNCLRLWCKVYGPQWNVKFFYAFLSGFFRIQVWWNLKWIT